MSEDDPESDDGMLSMTPLTEKDIPRRKITRPREVYVGRNELSWITDHTVKRLGPFERDSGECRRSGENKMTKVTIAERYGTVTNQFAKLWLRAGKRS